MKAAQYLKPHSCIVTEKDLRPLRPDELLVDVEACGVCGTDVHIVEGTSRSNPPVILGHEFAGRIAGVGSGVTTHRVGERVAVDPNIPCGMCFYCRRGFVHLCSSLRALGVDIDGGMAEFCLVPASQAHTLAEGVTPETGAYVEPVSCAVHGLDRANVKAGDTVVILGGGTIGLIMVQLAHLGGAARTVVSEPIGQKRALAAAAGATIVLDPATDNIREAVLSVVPEGADVVIECAGRPETARLALDLARRGGTVEFFGVCPIGSTVPLEPNSVYFRELTIVGSYVNPNTFSRAIDLLVTGKVRIDFLPVTRFPIEAVEEALRHQREGLTLKSVITP